MTWPTPIDAERILETFMNDITRSMLGHGYTFMCLPSDGSGDWIPVVMPLDTGDNVLFVTWEWANK